MQVMQLLIYYTCLFDITNFKYSNRNHATSMKYTFNYSGCPMYIALIVAVVFTASQVRGYVPYIDFEAYEQLTQSDLSLLFPVDEITGKLPD